MHCKGRRAGFLARRREGQDTSDAIPKSYFKMQGRRKRRSRIKSYKKAIKFFWRDFLKLGQITMLYNGRAIEESLSLKWRGTLNIRIYSKLIRLRLSAGFIERT